MSETLTLILLATASFVLVWLTAGYAVKKLVLAIEGSTEFGHGTTSRLRRAGGYAVFTTWMILATLPASFFADVSVHGDSGAATARLVDRLQIVAHILDVLGND